MQNKHNILNMKDLHACVCARAWPGVSQSRCQCHCASHRLARCRHWVHACVGACVRACASECASEQRAVAQGSHCQVARVQSSNKQPEHCHESDSESESDGDAAALAIANGSKTLGTMDA